MNRSRVSLHLVVLVLLLVVSSAFFTTTESRAQELAEHSRVAEALHLMDLWIDAQVAYEQIPGASVAVVHDQELVWSKGYGLANREEGLPATPETIYSICSISKLFTSVALMQQRDAGRVRLDDPVKEHLPWFRIQETYAEAGPATVEGLLTHSSGLPRESDHPYWSAPEFEFPTREEIRERISYQETLYPTLTYYQYSNLGLSMVGEIVMATSGMSFDEYIRSRILDPLGMTNTFTEIPARLHGKGMAVGYGAMNRDGERLRMPMFQARGIAPAAGFASTVEDLGRFASWQFRLLEGGGTEILDANTLREMQRVHWVDEDWGAHRGLGFGVWRNDDKTFVGHGGSCPGYKSHLSLQTGDKVAAAFATNAWEVSPSLYTRRMHEIVGPAIKEAVKEKEPGEETGAESGAGAGEAAGASPSGVDLSLYTGRYGTPFGREAAVLVWKGELAVLYLPTENPAGALTRLKHVDGHTFRRVRSDDELGEEYIFEMEDGEVVRMIRNSNFLEKIG
jgi:CubicO group peptidase (beta-lactamase class C family)